MTQHNALLGHAPKSTPQTQPIPGSTQVENSAGGFTWEVSVWDRVQRFLILGVEGGTYYIDQRKLVTENVSAIDEALKADGRKLVDLIIEISDAGRAPSNDPALFALAYAAKKGDDATRKYALDSLPKVARIGTHLFHWVGFVKSLGGFGRATRRAIANWYQPENQDELDSLAYGLIKYRQRDGWDHRDLLRLSHPKPVSRAEQDLYRWVVKGMPCAESIDLELPRVAEGFKMAQRAATPRDSAALIRQYGLPREAIQTEHLNDLVVWEALLENMPFNALVRNLATMTRIGLLESMSENTRFVAEKLADQEVITKSRIHPVGVLAALLTYQQGFSVRGDSRWNPLREIVDALDGTFYKAFGNVLPTGKRLLLALDVSSSMRQPVNGVPGLTSAMASAAMALVTASVEPSYQIVGFTSDSRGGWGYRRETELTELNISPRQRLDDAVREVSKHNFGRTDCAMPMKWARENAKHFDGFAVYTDNETYDGTPHAAQALANYRRETGLASRLAVLGTASNGFTIADPNDPGMLDVVGFDAATPNIIGEFFSAKL